MQSRLGRAARACALSAITFTCALGAHAAPADAAKCGSILGVAEVPCPTEIVVITGGPDLFGEVKGSPCLGAFQYDGEEGTRDYFSGYIQGATYLHTDADTRRMTVRCHIRDASTPTSGSVRGEASASSVAPLNFTASAAGRPISFWMPRDIEEPDIWMCTTVTWTDRLGINRAHHYDADPDAPGTQCQKFTWVLPI